jgi:hypothetical protein
MTCNIFFDQFFLETLVQMYRHGEGPDAAKLAWDELVNSLGELSSEDGKDSSSTQSTGTVIVPVPSPTRTIELGYRASFSPQM